MHLTACQLHMNKRTFDVVEAHAMVLYELQLLLSNNTAKKGNQ